MTFFLSIWRRVPPALRDGALLFIGLCFVVWVHFRVVENAREMGRIETMSAMVDVVNSATRSARAAQARMDSGVVRVDTLWREHKALARKAGSAIASIPATQRDTIRLYFPKTDTALVESEALVADTTRLEAEGRKLRADMLSYRSHTDSAMLGLSARILFVEKERDSKVSKKTAFITGLGSGLLGYVIGRNQGAR